MGLFGGFKAKFTKNSKEKKKHEQVVCVRYILSDFDTRDVEPSTLPRPRPKSEHLEKDESGSLPDVLIRSTSVERLPPPVRKPPAPLPRSSPPPLPKNPPPLLSKRPPPPPPSSPPPLPERHDVGEYIIVTNNDDDVNKRLSLLSNESGEEIPQDDQIAEYVEIRESNIYNPYEVSPKLPKSILKPAKKVEEDDYGEKQEIGLDKKYSENVEKTTRFSEESPVIFMTQSNSDSESGSDMKNEENGEDNFEAGGFGSFLCLMLQCLLSTYCLKDSSNIRCMNNDALKEIMKSSSFKINSSQMEDSYDEDFKVNVVKHDPEMQYSFSEDELSEDLDAAMDDNDYELIGYSSQAASIFFGGDVPPKPKPRKLLLSESDRNSIEGDC
nr:unnamed protein product [Callosobruchus chinensis]